MALYRGRANLCQGYGRRSARLPDADHICVKAFYKLSQSLFHVRVDSSQLLRNEGSGHRSIRTLSGGKGRASIQIPEMIAPRRLGEL